MFEWSVNDTKQWSYGKNIASFWRLISLRLEFPKIVANLSSFSPKFCADIFITSWWAVLPLDVGFKVGDMSGCHRTVCHIDNIKFNSLCVDFARAFRAELNVCVGLNVSEDYSPLDWACPTCVVSINGKCVLLNFLKSTTLHKPPSTESQEGAGAGIFAGVEAALMSLH